MIGHGLTLGTLSRISVENLDNQARDVREARAETFTGVAAAEPAEASTNGTGPALATDAAAHPAPCPGRRRGCRRRRPRGDLPRLRGRGRGSRRPVRQPEHGRAAGGDREDRRGRGGCPAEQPQRGPGGAAGGHDDEAAGDGHPDAQRRRGLRGAAVPRPGRRRRGEHGSDDRSRPLDPDVADHRGRARRDDRQAEGQARPDDRAGPGRGARGGQTTGCAASSRRCGKLKPGFELVTVYGTDAHLDEAEDVAKRIQQSLSGVDVELRHGGQPHYRYLISAE